MPRAERIVQQEVHHVLFGEQLRNCRQFVSANLVAGCIDLVLPLRLPELIAPAQAIARGEHLDRQPDHELDEWIAIFRREFHCTRRVVGSKDLGQFLRREPSRDGPRILETKRRGEFLAIFQRHGHLMLRRNEKVVLQ